MNADVSIVMVSYHTGPVLFDAVNAALKQEGLRELIIVDNGNPEEVRARLRKKSDKTNKLKYYTGHGNVGFAAGCNIGAKKALGEYILFLNPDCIIYEHTLAKVVAEMKAHEDAWLAGICMIGPEGKREGNNKRNLLTPEIALSEVFRLWKINDRKFPRINLYENDGEENTSYVPAISGAFMLIKNKRYNDVGGMDEQYFFHVEDMDFCKEIHVQGGKIIYIPSVKALHYRSSSNVTSFFVELHKNRGFLRYFGKHYPGLLTNFISLAIWTRFVLRIPKIMLREIRKKKTEYKSNEQAPQS